MGLQISEPSWSPSWFQYHHSGNHLVINLFPKGHLQQEEKHPELREKPT